MNKHLVAIIIIAALAVYLIAKKSPVPSPAPVVPVAVATPQVVSPTVAQATPVAAATPPFNMNQAQQVPTINNLQAAPAMQGVPDNVKEQLAKHAANTQAQFKAALSTIDGARGVLQQSEACINQINDPKNPGLPASLPANTKAQLQAACISLGKQAADAYPQLRQEFEEKVVKRAQ